MEILESNLREIYWIILGQCSEAMINKLMMYPGYETSKASSDCSWLLQSLKGEAKQQLPPSIRGQKKKWGRFSAPSEHQRCNMPCSWQALSFMIELLEDFYDFKQEPGVSLHDYYEEYCLKLDILERYTGGYAVGNYCALIEEEGDDEKKPKDKSAGILLLRGADRRMFEGLWTDLENHFCHSTDQHPDDLFAPLSGSLCYQPPWSSTQQKNSTRHQPGTCTHFHPNQTVLNSGLCPQEQHFVLQVSAQRALC
ncbi:hypothetical protein IV203_023176 [Nitzschia inconspicua]|uniref:Uncharacterized protein n=1 Tax=Nitzschia inconspicua TaxID=303405 RepID=A0A9K3KCS4_9STRA|nr:hypothetical protein IV203_023176 [Nitzschia inconspicua]